MKPCTVEYNIWFFRSGTVDISIWKFYADPTIKAHYRRKEILDRKEVTRKVHLLTKTLGQPGVSASISECFYLYWRRDLSPQEVANE